MSLDNALRSGLVREGEAIAVDVAAALPAIGGRVRAHRRRRALEGVAAALVVAVVVWAPPGLRTQTTEERPRPARERFPQEQHVERRERPPEGGVVPAEPGGSRSATPSLEATSHAPTRAAGAAPRRDAGEPLPPSTETSVGVMARRVIERYEVAYVSGTHVGENAGTGCTKGESAMGSNDCIPIQLDDDESEVSFRIVDDDGIVVGATVYQHAGGDGTELVSFCGSTDGHVEVEPGALLLVYLDTSHRCSEASPRSGTLTAFLR